MNNIQIYREKLLNADDESVFENVSNLYSDDLLEYKKFPSDYLNFLVELLTQQDFYSRRGVFYFIAIIGIETDLMTSKQLHLISDAIIENYVDYIDEMLCLTICDFIARYYPHKEAERILLLLKKLEDKKDEKGFANDGLRILSNEKQRTLNRS